MVFWKVKVRRMIDVGGEITASAAPRLLKQERD